MTRCLIRRLLAGIVTLLVFVTVLFFLAEILIPGDFVSQFTLSMPAEQRAQLREELGLNLPVWHHYLLFIGGLATGDLGSSYWGESVLSILLRFLPWTLLVFLIVVAVVSLTGFKGIIAIRNTLEPELPSTTGWVMLLLPAPLLMVTIETTPIGDHFGRSSSGSSTVSSPAAVRSRSRYSPHRSTS